MTSLTTLSQALGISPLAIISIVAWTLVWKGFALWRAATLRQKYWFVALLLINTLGLLEIVYLFLISRKYKVEYVDEK